MHGNIWQHSHAGVSLHVNVVPPLLIFYADFFLTLYNSFDLQIASAEQSPLAQVRFSLDRPKEVQNGYCGVFFKGILKIKEKINLEKEKPGDPLGCC